MSTTTDQAVLTSQGLGATHVGRRSNNEDAFVTDPILGFYAVADGMGGHEGGEVASWLAIESLHGFCMRAGARSASEVSQVTSPGSTVGQDMMALAFRQAHRSIQRQRTGRLSHMGSTAALVWVHGSRATIAHIGDSRVYMSRGGVLQQMTRDHSLDAELQEAGMVAKGITVVPGLITRALGIEGDGAAEVTEVELQAGDRFVICSDGLTDVVDDNMIQQILDHSPFGIRADALVNEAYRAGSRDNITVVSIEIKGS